MWVPSTWETEEDVENDLLLMAEYCIPTKESDSAVNRVPETILRYRKQMAENKQKPLNSDIDENASYIVSGRGRGIRDRVIRPGGVIDCHPSDDVELKKQIRQVAGFGYSNELIEQSIRAKGYDAGKGTNMNSTFKLVSSSSSNNSSRSSSETAPARKKKGGSSSDGNCNLTKDEFPPLK